MLRSAHYALSKENHLIHSDRQCVLIATNNIAGTIAHEKHINTCFVNQTGKSEIITGEHCNLFAILLHLAQLGCSHTAILSMYGHVGCLMLDVICCMLDVICCEKSRNRAQRYYFFWICAKKSVPLQPI